MSLNIAVSLRYLCLVDLFSDRRLLLCNSWGVIVIFYPYNGINRIL